MKRVLYLLLFVAACKSSSPDEKVDRIAVITENLLNEDISSAFRPEKLAGNIAHISEITYKAYTADDGYIKKDTILKEYLFSDNRPYKIASVSRRMPIDTLTIQYDTIGRLLALIHSDNRSSYNTDRFKYDAAGRRIEKTNRVYSSESRYVYEYNEPGDSLLVTVGPGRQKEGIYMNEEGDTITVTRVVFDEGLGKGTAEFKYNRQNQLVVMYHHFPGVVANKVIQAYDSHGNPVRWDYYREDPVKKGVFTGIDETLSYATEYTYDKNGNWTVQKQQMRDKSLSITTTRKITYR
jgi:YD repeat-containing protein